MIVPPGSAHAFRVPMIWDYIVIVRELFVADRAYARLLADLTVKQLSHLGRGPQFPISARVVRILDSLNSESYELWTGKAFTATAGQGSMDWA